MKYLFIILLLQSCSLKQTLLEAKYVKKSPVVASHTVSNLDKGEVDHVNKHRWQALLFISNDYSNPKPFELPSNLCANKDIITDYQVSFTISGHPLIWGTQDHDYQGKCHE